MISLQNWRFLWRIYQAAHKKFYVDEVYLFITKKLFSRWLVRRVGRQIYCRRVYEFAGLHHRKISALIKGLQSGKVQNMH